MPVENHHQGGRKVGMVAHFGTGDIIVGIIDAGNGVDFRNSGSRSNPIGGDASSVEGEPVPRVTLRFTNVDSVDVVLNALHGVREILRERAAARGEEGKGNE